MEWSAVEDELEKLIAANRDFSEATIKNAKDLLVYVSENCVIGDGVDRGYWPTINFHWLNARPMPVSVEVFDDHYEFYIFTSDLFEVYEYGCNPGEALPDEFKMRLKRIAL
ncbi:hypothetical protein OVA03_07390 [Asticcacaulis sp. SL142]|uniref:hypothetical protein n=1 Tax=Asticcacaulis sp. SL142 TaxID=2995155 RepID=UPI00226CA7B2|nr:hypothetical protein [Asticcacaulis sp. SL142]WAC49715.1 hypothetical protein OVA03_07390 [Asticcacaulis sp. SL142]